MEIGCPAYLLCLNPHITPYEDDNTPLQPISFFLPSPHPTVHSRTSTYPASQSRSLPPSVSGPARLLLGAGEGSRLPPHEIFHEANSRMSSSKLQSFQFRLAFISSRSRCSFFVCSAGSFKTCSHPGFTENSNVNRNTRRGDYAICNTPS